uniref:Ribosome assembly factor mrt4 n=1 Tax=Parastrongyloides trichosuri TaxID=131310 RepID=A0A0N4ZWD7_PARTI
MPRSKRDKEVSLTRVKKKTREGRNNLIAEIRACVDKYQYIYQFNLENLRSRGFIDVRQHFKTNSRFFFGKNNVMAIALGRTQETEYADGMYKVSKLLKGQCALMFSSVEPKQVLEYFKSFHKEDYARAGDVATETVSLDAGPLSQFAFSMEPQLRKMGLPTALEKGVISLVKDFLVCTKGETLNPEQCKILKALDIKMADFRLNVNAVFDKNDGLQILN